MITKITSSIISDFHKKSYAFIVFIMFISVVQSQTYTASPWRVTTDFTVIVTSDTPIFVPSDKNDDNLFKVQLYFLSTPNLGNSELWIKDTFKYISSTQMSFRVRTSQPYDQFGELYVKGNPTGIDIKYYGATRKESSNSNSNTNVNRITEIFTTYNHDGTNFWRSGDWKVDQNNENLMPNSNHDLLGFTVSDGGVETTYSTGVVDSEGVVNGKLIEKGISFVDQKYKAYSTNGVQGKINSNHYYIAGDAIDGNPIENEGSTISSSEILGMSVFKSIIDGENGLDLGTGITNFNDDVNVKFFSGNGDVGALDGTIPDLIITQIADAASSESNADLYYYAGEDGNLVGRPVSLYIAKNNNSYGPGVLARWRMDLFRYPNGVSFQAATPTTFRTGTNTYEKTLKMVGLQLEDFEIRDNLVTDPLDPTYYNRIELINNVNMAAGGNADIAFLAYNTASFDIRSPLAKRYPVSQFICKFPSTTDIEFNVIADIEGREPMEAVEPDEELTYEWYKYNVLTSQFGSIAPASVQAAYPIPAGATVADLGIYNLHITNTYGTIILPVTLQEGGTPYVWNGTNWNFPPVYQAANILPGAPDRNLIFAADYNPATPVDLEGCNCTVGSDNDVVIGEGKTVKLYREITVAPEISVVLDSDGNDSIPASPRGTFTLMDDANLIQTFDVGTSNQNSGEIVVRRQADNLNRLDYVYWSSPVEDFNINGIFGGNTPRFSWDPTLANTGGSGTTGNYVSASGAIMSSGIGYIARVPNSMPTSPAPGVSATTIFTGRATNGNVTVDINKSSGTFDATQSHWNLIGNPYPSSIDATKLLNANAIGGSNLSAGGAIIEGAVHLWTHGNAPSGANSNPYYEDFQVNYGNDYVSYNGTGSNPSGFDGKIASGQAFFVQGLSSNSSTEQLTFTNDLRFDNSENAYNNSQFYRLANNSENDDAIEKQLVWLGLSGENAIQTTALVGYVDGATLGKDGLYDASITNNTFAIYSVIENYTLGIQGRPAPFQDSDLVPLGIAVPSNGIYTIALDHLEGSNFVDQGQDMYVEDLYLNVIHDLRESPYSFTATSGVVNDRFVLRFTSENSTLSISENEVAETFIYITDRELKVRSGSSIESVAVYDITGKLIMNDVLKNSSDTYTSDFNYARSVYFVMVVLENGAVVKKKLIN
ncbi:MAG: hypothetical protein WA775_12230 [Psychroserpens sp.]|uniref:hypothetical protein n=1 Tax=Psychroserpens sp. TaxID=2020870 RepID=UPI003C813529